MRAYCPAKTAFIAEGKNAGEMTLKHPEIIFIKPAHK
jgi:hypothetical protein